jgi:hypothetical protein
MTAAPIRLISAREHFATLEVVTPGGEPAVGEVSRALSLAGVEVVFSEARVVDGMFRERIHLAHNGTRPFTRGELGEILLTAIRALGPRFAQARQGQRCAS